jgi:hypothetical protein
VWNGNSPSEKANAAGYASLLMLFFAITATFERNDPMKRYWDSDSAGVKLRGELQLASSMLTPAEAAADPSVPVQWQRFIDEQAQGRMLALLTEWSDVAAEWPSVQDFLRTMLKRLYLLREQDGTLSLLYLYTVGGNDLNVYRGRAPITEVPERLRPIWNRVPATFRDFYTQLHDGWTFLPANSMGPLPVEDWAFLSDDKFDIDDATARALPIDISKTVAVFHNGAGDYLCLNCAGNGEATGVIWWHEDPANPEPVDFWGVLDAWVDIFLEEADRHGT